VSLRRLYLGLSIVGTVLPLAVFWPFVRDHGFAPGTFFEQLFANPTGRAFATDLTLTALIFWLFAIVESRRLGIRHVWLPILASATIGVSCGLPLFLYLRERHRETFPGGSSAGRQVFPDRRPI
jgi:hypothetical protein